MKGWVISIIRREHSFKAGRLIIKISARKANFVSGEVAIKIISKQ
jgi:hypothetical protein